MALKIGDIDPPRDISKRAAPAGERVEGPTRPRARDTARASASPTELILH